MNNKLPILSKKTMTKMLDKNFRNRILLSLSQKKQDELCVEDYAKYIVQQQKNTKDGNKIFPMQVLTCSTKDGSLRSKILELSPLNHFLMVNDEASAIEVAKCICILWQKEYKDICKFIVLNKKD